jgi:hypothetical protein
MKITRNVNETGRGPSDWFTGDVYLDTIARPSDSSPVGAASVHFTPGARTAWHTHPHGQAIWVSEGVGLCQREGGPIEIIRQGDRVFSNPLRTTGTEPLPAASSPHRDPAGRRERQSRFLGSTRQRRRVRTDAPGRRRRTLMRTRTEHRRN